MKVAFSIFNVEIYWYAILIVIAIVLGLLICRRDKEKYTHIINMSIFLIPISIICARIYYIIFNPSQNFFNFRDGGLAIYGGIIGGTFVVIAYCIRNKLNILEILDYIVPSLALGQCIGRWGNFINQEAYGIETKMPWGMKIIENGLEKTVHPTFLYESIITFLLFIILIKMNRKGGFPCPPFNGQITLIYLITYSLFRIIIEYLRTDSLMLYNLKISMVLSIIIFVISCSIFTHKVIMTKNKKINVK